MPASDHLQVFDIKRFAINDGDGIRTTVFLKGCGLRCLWCQNPEGLEKKKDVLYLANKCIHCGSCARVAKEGQLYWDKDHPVLNHEYAGSNEDIVNSCPTGAIHYDSTDYSIDELFSEICKDEVFFKHGGGVTFSGGEPLLGGKALIHLLRICKERGIHTACETALFVPEDIVKEASELLDQIYCDLKVFDNIEHTRLTGKENKLIKKNLQYLLQSQHAAKVIIRTPLIPGMTDSEENIREIATWISFLYPEVKYELLNYNELAPAKYPMTGRQYIPGERKKLTEERLELLRQVAREAGVQYLVQ